jgi:hypothetical protein
MKTPGSVSRRAAVCCAACALLAMLLSAAWRLHLHAQHRKAVAGVAALGGLAAVESAVSSEAASYLPKSAENLFHSITSVAFNDRRADDQTLWSLAQLRGLSRLRGLYLNGTGVSDAGLVHLAAFTRLEELYLEDTVISDQGLRNLETLSSLRLLSVRNTAVTAAGVERLKQALPRLELLGWRNMRAQSM